MPSLLDWVKEVRSWVILGIVLILLAGVSYGVYWIVKSQETKKYESQILAKDRLLGDRDKLLADQKKLLADKDKRIAELEIALTAKPKATIQYIHDKPQVVGGGAVQSGNTVVVNSGDSVELARKAYCDAAERHGVVPLCVIKSKGVRCQANICNPDDANKKVEITEEGDQAIHHTVDNVAKPTVWAHLGILGYNPVDNALLIGYAPFDWRGLLVGVNVFSDFKTSEHSGAGAFVGYRPEIDIFKNSTIKVNLMVGLGAATHFDDFKRVGLEGVIGAVVTERVKK